MLTMNLNRFIITTVPIYNIPLHMKHTIKSPPNTSKPTNFVMAIRVTEDEYAACKAIAEAEQRSISQVGRILIKKSLSQQA